METYALEYPVVRRTQAVGGAPQEETISEVTIRRVTGADMRSMEANKGATSLDLVARLTGLHSTVVDLMDAADIAAIAGIIEGFLPNSLRTGETS